MKMQVQGNVEEIMHKDRACWTIQLNDYSLGQINVALNYVGGVEVGDKITIIVTKVKPMYSERDGLTVVYEGTIIRTEKSGTAGLYSFLKEKPLLSPGIQQ
jgi:hypothetical protein